MKHRSEALTAEEAVEVRFEVRVAQLTDSFIQATILKHHIQGTFDLDGEREEESEEESEYETETEDEDEELNADGTLNTEKNKKPKQSRKERDKMKRGMSAITNAQAGGANAKAREGRTNMREEAEALAAEAESKSLLDHDREVKMLFKAVDTDGGGSLDIDEVKLLLTKLGMDVTDDAVNTVMDEMDPDGDGEIMLGEFQTWWKAAGSDVKGRMTRLSDATAVRKQREEREKAREKASGKPGSLSTEEVQELFKAMDADGGGYLDRQEVSMLLKKIGLNVDAEGLDKVMEEMDPNGDAEVDVHEFSYWFKRSGKRLQEKLTAFADSEIERKERERLAKHRADAGKSARVQARKKMRQFELDLQRAALLAWRATAKKIQEERGGLAIRVWDGMNEQQRALHIAGGVVAEQGANLKTAEGRLTPRTPHPRGRVCAECGERFVLLQPDSVASGLGKALTHANAVTEDKERTKVLFAAQTKMDDLVQMRDAIMKTKEVGPNGKIDQERAFMLGKAEADIVKLDSVIKREQAKLLHEMEARKRHVEERGERRAIPNRQLCEKHRPRLCRYTEANGFGSLGALGLSSCGRVFSLADPHCRAGGVCCE